MLWFSLWLTTYQRLFHQKSSAGNLKAMAQSSTAGLISIGGYLL